MHALEMASTGSGLSATQVLIEQAAYEVELQSLVRDYPALKEKLKTSLKRTISSSSDSSERRVVHDRVIAQAQRPHPPNYFAMRDRLRTCKVQEGVNIGGF
jgi:hypothetical protein